MSSNGSFSVRSILSGSFGASRAPVREALFKLCNENILRSIPRTGYQIIQLNMKDINDAIRTRVILEIGRVKKLLSNVTPDIIQQLEEWWKNNTDFHVRISSCAGNTLLKKMKSNSFQLLQKTLSR